MNTMQKMMILSVVIIAILMSIKTLYRSFINRPQNNVEVENSVQMEDGLEETDEEYDEEIAEDFDETTQ